MESVPWSSVDVFIVSGTQPRFRFPPSRAPSADRIISSTDCGFARIGHVEKFTDLMVKDTVTGVPSRADQLLEALIDQLLADNPAMPKVVMRF